MPRIAISGHRGLNVRTTDLIDRAIRERLSRYPAGVTGLSILADGQTRYSRVPSSIWGEHSKPSFRLKNTGQACPPRRTPNMTTC